MTAEHCPPWRASSGLIADKAANPACRKGAVVLATLADVAFEPAAAAAVADKSAAAVADKSAAAVAAAGSPAAAAGAAAIAAEDVAVSAPRRGPGPVNMGLPVHRCWKGTVFWRKLVRGPSVRWLLSRWRECTWRVTGPSVVPFGAFFPPVTGGSPLPLGTP